MIKCVNIHSYKLLNNLSLESFGHFNIFTGRNNVGKTSVLEAIYLNTWDESPMENLIKVFDKFRNFRLNKSSAEFLFYKGNLDSNISITTQFDDKDIHKITLEINAGESGSVDGYNMELNFRFNFKENDSVSEKNAKLIIQELGSTHNDNKNIMVSRQIECDKVLKIKPYYKKFDSVFISSNILFVDIFDYFTKVLQAKKKKEFLEYLKVFDESIIDVLQIANNVHIELLDGESYPIQSYGIGFVKYFVICCLLVRNFANYIFIDEIENGLHYKNMEKFLNVILKLSQEYAIQVFVTTHNAEFLQKMLNSSKKQDIRDIVLFNLYKNKGEVKASRYDYFSIKQELVEYGSELRF